MFSQSSQNIKKGSKNVVQPEILDWRSISLITVGIALRLAGGLVNSQQAHDTHPLHRYAKGSLYSQPHNAVFKISSYNLIEEEFLWCSG